jgi:hypothetical protein
MSQDLSARAEQIIINTETIKGLDTSLADFRDYSKEQHAGHNGHFKTLDRKVDKAYYAALASAAIGSIGALSSASSVSDLLAAIVKALS